MDRDFHFKLADQSETSKAEYRTRLKIDKSSIHIDVSIPGDEMARGIWVEIIDGEVVVRTYDPQHEGPKTTVICSTSQEQHSNGYD